MMCSGPVRTSQLEDLLRLCWATKENQGMPLSLAQNQASLYAMNEGGKENQTNDALPRRGNSRRHFPSERATQEEIRNMTFALRARRSVSPKENSVRDVAILFYWDQNSKGPKSCGRHIISSTKKRNGEGGSNTHSATRLDGW